MASSSIEWTDKVWNPVRGCALVSPGCTNCYAMKQAHRFSGVSGAYEGLTRLRTKGGPVWTGKAREVPEMLGEPLRWRKPARVFVNSMSDLFHEDVSDDFIAAVFGVMAASPQHTFQVLTKRPGRMRAWFGRNVDHETECGEQASRALGEGGFSSLCYRPSAWPLPNVWLGVSVEDQARADARIPHLIATPAAVRFLSCEPLLGPVNIANGASNRWSAPTRIVDGNPVEWTDPGAAFVPVDWVIVGGESGPGARPFDLAWGRSLVEQCREARVPVFFKQLGDNPIMSPGPITWPTTAHHGADPSEWPADLRVREFPGVSRG